jgi:hypothetical protein
VLLLRSASGSIGGQVGKLPKSFQGLTPVPADGGVTTTGTVDIS